MAESHPPGHEPSEDPIKSILGKFELFQKFLVTVLAIFGVAAALGNSGSISHNCMLVVVTILSFALLSFLLSMQLRFTRIAIGGVIIGSASLVVAFLIIASALVSLQLSVIFIIAILVVITFCFYAIIKEEADAGEQHKIKKEADVVKQEEIEEDGSAADSNV